MSKETAARPLLAEELAPHRLFDLTHTLAAPFFEAVSYPWELLPAIPELLLSLRELLSAAEYTERADGVLVARSARISPLATIEGTAIIGPRCEVRPGAYLRGGVLIGADAVIGNSSELKNSILFDGAQVPHDNYVGDSILGYRAHLGAGATASNLRADRAPVAVHAEGGSIATGLVKLGALVGDLAEVGCHAVLCPGTVIGRRTQIYPTACVRGVVGEDRIVKCNGSIVKREVQR